MTADVVITGTGIPPASARRAGASVLVRVGTAALQFDAGRAITMRLAALGVGCRDLTAVFLTHHHSDHLMGLDDLVFSRWFESNQQAYDPLPVVAPDGPCARYVERMLDPWDEEIAVRVAHAGNGIRPGVDLRSFVVGSTPTVVWRQGEIQVSAVHVHHEPVVPAVGYRVDSHLGSVAISGDTIVCEELERLARGADVLVHSALSRAAVASTDYAWVASYHADSVGVGELAARAGVRMLVLTHLLPPPDDERLTSVFVADVRRGGFTGRVLVAEDLDTVSLTEKEFSDPI